MKILKIKHSKIVYKYINSIVKYKLETKEQNIEIDNDNKLDEQFYILNKSFINLKKNRQRYNGSFSTKENN